MSLKMETSASPMSLKEDGAASTMHSLLEEDESGVNDTEGDVS